MSLKRITKAVIPAAGLGTRLFPLTRHLPKELLPVGSKPMIQHTVEAYLDSDIRDLYIIISPSKDLVRAFLIESRLPPGLPFRDDPSFRSRLKSCSFTFLIQEQAVGVADAVSLARPFIGSDPFFCIMPDCLLFGSDPFPAQLLDAYQRYATNVIGTILIPEKDLNRFGNVGLLETHCLDQKTVRITSLSPKSTDPFKVRRPGPYQKGFGGGIYLPEYFELAEKGTRDRAGELDDVPIHHAMIHNKRLIGTLLEGDPFDTGHPLGLRAAAHFQGRRTQNPDRHC